MSKPEKIAEYDKVPINEPEKNDNPPKYGYGVRHIQLAIFLLCLTVSIIGRGHMGVTIVAMTSHLEDTMNASIDIKTTNETNASKFATSANISHDEYNNTGVINKSIENDVTINNIEKKHKTWNWPKSVQEMILNAFFLGYMIMMFPMGMVCQRYGGKLPLQISLFINGIVSIIMPSVTIWGGWKGLCICRILQGLSQAGTYPSIQNLLAKWVPDNELGSLGCVVHTGLTIGTVIAFQMAGFLGGSKWGWPSTFYAVGIICLLCFVLLTIFGAASPQEHRSITEEETKYIMGESNNGSIRKLKTPWRGIFTSKPLWGTIATHVGTTISFVLFLNQVPTYIHYILGVDVKSSGLLSSLPYVASIFSMLGFGWLSDYCTNNNIVSKNNARRICNSMAQFGMASCLILTSYTRNTAMVVTCLVIGMALNMGINTGWMVNYIDLSPNFSGTLTATGNTLANIFIVLTTVVVSYMVTDMTNVIQWRIMFFMAAGISIITNTIFVLMVSTDVQPWNYSDQNELSIEDLKANMKAKKKSIDVIDGVIL